MAPHPRWLNAPASSTWQNLGDWSTHQTYPQAAQALAIRLGSAARLNADDTVADIGCGQGDQLLVWRQQFQVGQVVGFEPNRQSADAAAERVRHQMNIRVVCGTDRQLSTPSAPSGLLPASARSLAETASTSSTPHLKDTSSPSVVLSLDAAYHFRSRASFLRRAAAALAPGGRLALGDLFIPKPRIDLKARLVALFAGIPQRNLWTQPRWHHELKAAGFDVVQFEDTTEAVLAGFGRYAQTSGPRWFKGLDPLAIQATAVAARHAHQYGWLGFAIIVAQRR